MVQPTTLTALADLEQEMADAGRSREQGALHDALRALGRDDHDLLTTGQAADRLSVSIPTVKRWVERGALAGGVIGGRWQVSAAGVDHLVRLRAALAALDDEGNPTTEELHLLRRRHRGSSLGLDGAASGA